MNVEVNEDREIIFSEIYNAIGVHVEDGTYGICERDGHLVVVLDGKEIFKTITHVNGDNIIDPSRCPHCAVYDTCIIKGTCSGFVVKE